MIGDRSPTSPAPDGATSPGSLAGLRPSPPEAGHHQARQSRAGSGEVVPGAARRRRAPLALLPSRHASEAESVPKSRRQRSPRAGEVGAWAPGEVAEMRTEQSRHERSSPAAVIAIGWRAPPAARAGSREESFQVLRSRSAAKSARTVSSRAKNRRVARAICRHSSSESSPSSAAA